MNFIAARTKVLNRGIPPLAFLQEMAAWAKGASDDIFAYSPAADIYGKVRVELGPFTGILHRKAVMLEVMRVLAGFEASWNWNEGVDVSRAGADTNENSEAGAWQVSYDSRSFDPSLKALLALKGIQSGVSFQKAMKRDHALAMEYVARLMRFTTKHNGPLYKGAERSGIRASLRGEEHSIYPWLKREAVAEFQAALVMPAGVNLA